MAQTIYGSYILRSRRVEARAIGVRRQTNRSVSIAEGQVAGVAALHFGIAVSLPFSPGWPEKVK